MARRTFIPVFLFFLMLSADLSAWSRTGHATVAQVAENHLTPKAKATLRRYLGVPLAAIASDADTYRAVWTLDLGFIPTNPGDARLRWLSGFDFSTPENISPWSHSITVDKDFVSYRSDNLRGAYINNIAYYVDSLSSVLGKRAEKMDSLERYRAIALITHFMGDMHCPMHIVYLPDNSRKGNVNVKYKGKSTTLHSLWDGKVFSEFSQSFLDMSFLVDTANPEEISSIVSGSVYDWAGDSAARCWNAQVEYVEGDTLPSTYVVDHRDLLFSQLRNGGYRLARILNDIFK